MNKLMIGFSTENNIINIIPALQLGIDKILLITSKKAHDNSWNIGIKKICKARNIDFEEKLLEEKIESFLNGIHISLAEIKSEYSNHEIFINITGGQKNFSTAATLFVENSDKLIYFDGNREGLFIIGDKKEEFLKCDDMESPLELVEVFLLKNIKVGNGLKVFGQGKNKINDRQEIRKISKEFSVGKNIPLFYEKNIHNPDKSKLSFLSGLEEYFLKGKGLLNVLEIQFIEKQIKEMKKYFKLDKFNVSHKETINNVRSIFENVKIEKSYDQLTFSKSKNPSTGALYETMCLEKVVTYFENNPVESIEGIYFGVELKNEVNKVINELDIVILLKTGKLIVFEIKTGAITKIENKELLKQQNIYSELVYILCGITSIMQKSEFQMISNIIYRQKEAIETKKIGSILFDEIESYLKKI